MQRLWRFLSRLSPFEKVAARANTFILSRENRPDDDRVRFPARTGEVDHQYLQLRTDAFRRKIRPWPH
jgi:hypothetical protein